MIAEEEEEEEETTEGGGRGQGRRGETVGGRANELLINKGQGLTFSLFLGGREVGVVIAIAAADPEGRDRETETTAGGRGTESGEDCPRSKTGT